jgi:hypothetical protein
MATIAKNTSELQIVPLVLQTQADENNTKDVHSIIFMRKHKITVAVHSTTITSKKYDSNENKL